MCFIEVVILGCRNYGVILISKQDDYQQNSSCIRLHPNTNVVLAAHSSQWQSLRQKDVEIGQTAIQTIHACIPLYVHIHISSYEPVARTRLQGYPVRPYANAGMTTPQ